MLVISYSDLKKDPRVNRELVALKDDYELSAVGFNDSGIPDVHFHRAGLKDVKISGLPYRVLCLLRKKYETYYYLKYDVEKLIPELRKERFDVIIANDCDSLPFAFQIKGNAKVLFDAHEFAPEEYDQSFTWRLLHKKRKESICRDLAPRCDLMTTVSSGIAKLYAERFNLSPQVLTSAAKYHDLQPTPLINGKIRLVHHGLAAPERNLTCLVKMMDHLDERFTLDFYLMDRDKAYLNQLKNMAAGNPRIMFHDPVPLNELIKEANQFDVGIIPYTPFNNNIRYALPNKFFEFIQSRLAVAVTPLPELASYVNEYGLGVVSDDFGPQSLAKGLKELTPEGVWAMKQKSDQTAGILSAERNMELLRSLVGSLVSAHP